jgi:hypothetical protein
VGETRREGERKRTLAVGADEPEQHRASRPPLLPLDPSWAVSGEHFPPRPGFWRRCRSLLMRCPGGLHGSELCLPGPGALFSQSNAAFVPLTPPPFVRRGAFRAWSAALAGRCRTDCFRRPCIIVGRV